MLLARSVGAGRLDPVGSRKFASKQVLETFNRGPGFECGRGVSSNCAQQHRERPGAPFAAGGDAAAACMCAARRGLQTTRTSLACCVRGSSRVRTLHECRGAQITRVKRTCARAGVVVGEFSVAAVRRSLRGFGGEAGKMCIRWYAACPALPRGDVRARGEASRVSSATRRTAVDRAEWSGCRFSRGDCKIDCEMWVIRGQGYRRRTLGKLMRSRRWPSGSVRNECLRRTEGVHIRREARKLTCDIGR